MTAYSRKQQPVFLFLLMVFLWLIPIGMTFNGVVALIEGQPVTLGLLSLGMVLWGGMRWRAGWHAYRTPFDGALVVWCIAIGVSIVANMETWRRSAEAVWYVVLYGVMLYVVADLLANRAVTRGRLLAVYLLVGAMLLGVGVLQALNGLAEGGERVAPVSLLGNGNAFGVVLASATVAGLALSVMGVWRRLSFVYALVAGGLLIMTFSRGAWLGAGAGMVFVMLAWLHQAGVRSAGDAYSRWRVLSIGLRRAWAMMGVGVLVGVVIAGIILVQSLGIGGRSLDNRTFLWDCALFIFEQQPLTGSGLYTYGRTLPLCEPIPPQQPHSHAHSLPLLVLAEMGIVGAVALVMTVLAAARGWWLNWRVTSERPYLMASGAGVVAVFTHHWLDTPAMMPSVALWCLGFVAIASLPSEQAQVMQARWRRGGHAWGLMGAGVALVLVGAWAVSLHGAYRSALIQAVRADDWRGGALALEGVLASDPANSAYRLQTAYLWGRATVRGDDEALGRAIGHYEAYLKSEPYHTANWANLAALYWQAGDVERAQDAIAEAQRLAPTWAHYARQAGIYAGEAGDLGDVVDLGHGANRDGANYARFQFLRDIITEADLGEYLPQVGWGR